MLVELLRTDKSGTTGVDKEREAVLRPPVVLQIAACGEYLATPLYRTGMKPQAQVESRDVLLQTGPSSKLGATAVTLPGPEVEVDGVQVQLQVGWSSSEVLVTL